MRKAAPGHGGGVTNLTAPSKTINTPSTVSDGSYEPLDPWGVQGDAVINAAPYYGVFLDASAAAAGTGPVFELGVASGSVGIAGAVDATLATMGYWELYAQGPTKGALLGLHSESGAFVESYADDSAGYGQSSHSVLAGSMSVQVFAADNGSTTRQAWIQLTESPVEPGAPGGNRALIFSRDNGAGKTQLCVKFPTGAVQVLATQP
jgi:hypothetical protein